MKRKPRIFKRDGSWMIHLPAYGFGTDKLIDGFGTREQAHDHLLRFMMFSGSAQVERASRPDRPGWHELYPMRIIGDHSGI